MSCPACFTGSQHSHGTPKGEITTLHGLTTYITPPLSQNLTTKHSIVFFCDAFGLNLVNNKLLADEYAEGTGIRVFVPALPPNPCPVWVMTYLDEVMKPVGLSDVWGQLGRINKGFWLATTFVPFLIRQKPALFLPTALEYSRKIKSEAGDGAKLGVAGFCWGGYVSTNICKETFTSDGSERLVDAHFTAHPSALKAPDMLVDSVKTHKVPLSLAYPSEDFVLKAKEVEAAKTELEKLKSEDSSLEYEIRIYEGQQHGFSVRGDATDEKILQPMEQAKKQAIDWFKKYLI